LKKPLSGCWRDSLERKWKVGDYFRYNPDGDDSGIYQITELNSPREEYDITFVIVASGFKGYYRTEALNTLCTYISPEEFTQRIMES